MRDQQQSMARLIDSGAIPPFVYAYPVRSAYRRLPSRWTIDRIWHGEIRADIRYRQLLKDRKLLRGSMSVASPRGR